MSYCRHALYGYHTLQYETHSCCHILKRHLRVYIRVKHVHTSYCRHVLQTRIIYISYIRTDVVLQTRIIWLSYAYMYVCEYTCVCVFIWLSYAAICMCVSTCVCVCLYGYHTLQYRIIWLSYAAIMKHIRSRN